MASSATSFGLNSALRGKVTAEQVARVRRVAAATSRAVRAALS
jgi:hypothetical protein